MGRFIIILVSYLSLALAFPKDEKRGLWDDLAGGAGRLVAGTMDAIAPTDFMKAGCKDVLSMRKERSIFGGLSEAAGRLVGGASDVFLPEAMVKGGFKEACEKYEKEHPTEFPAIPPPPPPPVVYVQDPPIWVQDPPTWVPDTPDVGDDAGVIAF